MKQTKHKHIVSIWHRPPKGVRAGNSPVWKDEQLEFNEEEASENISKIIKSPGYKKLSREERGEINKFVNAEYRREN